MFEKTDYKIIKIGNKIIPDLHGKEVSMINTLISMMDHDKEKITMYHSCMGVTFLLVINDINVITINAIYYNDVIAFIKYNICNDKNLIDNIKNFIKNDYFVVRTFNSKIIKIHVNKYDCHILTKDYIYHYLHFKSNKNTKLGDTTGEIFEEMFSRKNIKNFYYDINGNIYLIKNKHNKIELNSMRNYNTYFTHIHIIKTKLDYILGFDNIELNNTLPISYETTVISNKEKKYSNHHRKYFKITNNKYHFYYDNDYNEIICNDIFNINICIYLVKSMIKKQSLSKIHITNDLVDYKLKMFNYHKFNEFNKYFFNFVLCIFKKCKMYIPLLCLEKIFKNFSIFEINLIFLKQLKKKLKCEEKQQQQQQQQKRKLENTDSEYSNSKKIKTKK